MGESMQSISIRRDIKQPAAKVWAVVDAFGDIYKFNPNVHTSPLQNDRASSFGAERVCHFEEGMTMKETIVQYDAGRGYTVRLADHPMPFKEATAHLDIAPTARGHCQFIMRVEFGPKFGPIGWLMANLMIKRMMNGLAKGLWCGDGPGVRVSPSAPGAPVRGRGSRA
jgi:hypothetical protein